MAMKEIVAIVFAVAGTVCWLLPGEIGDLLSYALPVGGRQSAAIGSLFFTGAAVLWFVRPSGEKGP